MKPRLRLLSIALAPLAGLALPAGPTRAQVRPVYDTGAEGLVQLLDRLPTVGSVLHTGAHPDDEDSALIARLARGDHARVAYLSLNRGEGGQNVIGPEQGEALGVVRTEELLQARRLDGGEQLFTRTYDFGFSKRREEAEQKWGVETALADVVRAIRLFRPLVVVSRWTGTPIDGHGQHQLAGQLTRLAFDQAGDPARFPEHAAEGLRPWRPLKLYVSEPFRPDPAFAPTLRLDTGRFDPVLGRSYFEIAMEGRSQHKSQEQGVPELRGPQSSGVRLVASSVSAPSPEGHVFDGIDVSIAGIAAVAGLPAGSLAEELAAVQGSAQRAAEAFVPKEPARAIPALAEGLRAVRDTRRALEGTEATAEAKAEAAFLLLRKEREFEEALEAAAGVVVDALADTETVAAGETAIVTTRVFVPDPRVVTVGSIDLRVPAGWKVVATTAPPPAPGRRRPRAETALSEASFEITVGGDAAPTQPYWLHSPRRGDLYQWPDGAARGRPFGDPVAEAVVGLEIGGAAVSARRAVQYRLIDPARGELRRDLDVVPALTLDVEPDLLVLATSAADRARQVSVRIEKGARSPLAGQVRLDLPPGWRSEPVEAPFRLDARGERVGIHFRVSVPRGAEASAYRVAARASVGDRTFDRALRAIEYPHIQTHRLYSRAEAVVRVFDLQVAPVRVGYVMGSGDRVPEAIRSMGLSLALLDEDALSTGDLARFDTIVVGVRAAQVRPDFVATHGRLLDFARQGGTLLVQYQRPEYAERALPPFPAKICGRVTDEAAAVTILRTAHPAFTFPNRIGPGDWEGWVQERSLEHLDDFDPRYRTLLEAHDPGEGHMDGSIVVAELGRGRYVYTGLSFFRQLPAGVPGAYRLFANLLSLPKAGAGSAGAKPARGSSR